MIIMHTLYKEMPANTEAENYKHETTGSCGGEDSSCSLLGSGTYTVSFIKSLHL
jgi:hypothetical protein